MSPGPKQSVGRERRADRSARVASRPSAARQHVKVAVLRGDTSALPLSEGVAGRQALDLVGCVVDWAADHRNGGRARGCAVERSDKRD